MSSQGRQGPASNRHQGRSVKTTPRRGARPKLFALGLIRPHSVRSRVSVDRAANCSDERVGELAQLLDHPAATASNPNRRTTRMVRRRQMSPNSRPGVISELWRRRTGSPSTARRATFQSLLDRSAFFSE